MAQAIDAQGTIFTFADDAVAPQVIGGIMSFSISSTKPEREITTLASLAVERKLGLPDNGTLTLEVLYDRTDLGQAALISADETNATRELVMVLSSGETATFQATPKTPPIDASADDDLKSSIELVITGAIVWT